MKAGQSTFEIVCKNHGKYEHGRDSRHKYLKSGELKGKRKMCCPLCKKEYIKKYKLKAEDISSIDWRYISFDKEEK